MEENMETPGKSSAFQPKKDTTYKALKSQSLIKTHLCDKDHIKCIVLMPFIKKKTMNQLEWFPINPFSQEGSKKRDKK